MADILTKICILAAIMGISLLIIISDKISIPSSEISSITEIDIDKNIKINGRITKIIKKGNSLAILDIADKNSTIKAVIFRPEKPLNIKKGDFIEINGKVSVYNEELQIIADSIKV